jgi:hypothetical protein
MVNYVFGKAASAAPVALTVVGWISFAAGVLLDSPFVRLILLSAARVLP